MFGLGFTEILVILAVALIFLGPDKLPEAARTLGRALGEFRRTLDEIKLDIARADIPPAQVPPEHQRSGLNTSPLNRELPNPLAALKPESEPSAATTDAPVDLPTKSATESPE